MKKYRVTFEQTETFDVVVEANDEQEADDLATERFNNGDAKETGDCEVSSIEVIELCDICEKPEDADGRCDCTNKDAHGI